MPVPPPIPLQLLSAVAYLHDRWVMHRDLKLSNLLFTHSGELCYLIPFARIPYVCYLIPFALIPWPASLPITC